MIIKFIDRAESEVEECDYRNAHQIIVEGSDLKLTFCDGEPEDNSLCRNFGDVYSIRKLVQAAYEAGVNGEELKIVESASVDL
jgi:hypothetical protein